MTIPQRIDIVRELASQRQGRPDFFPWDQVQGNFGREPGKVFIDDFDLGVVKTLGAFLDPNSSVDEPSFVLPVSGLKPEAQRMVVNGEEVVPVTFGHPEAYMSIWTMPGIFIRRESIEPDLQRYSQELEGFRQPAPNTKTTVFDVSFQGPTVQLIGRRYDGRGNIVINTTPDQSFTVTGMSGGDSQNLPKGSLSFPSGDRITDGEAFTLADGVNAPRTFEFDKDGVVSAANIGIAITDRDTDSDVAYKVQQAVNSAGLDIVANGIVGPNELHSRSRPEAYNFVYLIDLLARYQTDAQALLRTVLPRWKQHKAVIVRDSKGDLNEYTAFLEGIDVINEILGVTLKHVGYTITVRVVGEMDLLADDFRPTARILDFGAGIKRDGKGIDIDTGEIFDIPPPKTVAPDGLPLKTYPSMVLGRICSHLRK